MDSKFELALDNLDNLKWNLIDEKALVHYLKAPISMYEHRLEHLREKTTSAGYRKFLERFEFDDEDSHLL